MECGDCKRPNPAPFMVNDDLWVWRISGPNLLCLECAEIRLGRAFTAHNFKRDLPVNDWVFAAFRRRRL